MKTLESRALLFRTVAGVLFICSILLASTVHYLRESHKLHIQRGVGVVINQANLLSHELSTEIRLIDNALSTIAYEFKESGGLVSRLENAVLNQHVMLPFSKAVRVADARGVVRMGLLPGETTFSISEREYFSEVKNADRMVISEPLISRSSQGWSVILARRLEAKDGSFQGVAFVVLDVRHFRNVFEKLTPGKDSATTLRSAEGRVVARYSALDPTSTAGTGGTLTSAALKETRRLNPDQGWYIAPTALDGIERITAYRRLSALYPLTVYTGIGTDAYLQSWRKEATAASLLAGFCVLLIAFGAARLFVYQQREQNARIQAAQLLKEQNFFVENDLIGMIKVRRRKIVTANRAMARLLCKQVSELLGQSTKIIYPDHDTFERMGRLSSEALRRGKTFRIEVQLKNANGELFWVDANAAQVAEDELVWIFVNINSHKKREEEVEHRATHDGLTGLANRRLVLSQMSHFMALADRGQGSVAACFLDLDGFKQVNDHFGHNAGDIVLKTVAERIKNSVRPSDCVARLGGDEFLILLVGLKMEDEALQIMRRCLNFVRNPIIIDGNQATEVGCSIGISHYSGGHEPQASVLKRADEAMYMAKHAGKGQIIESSGARPVSRSSEPVRKAAIRTAAPPR